MSQFEQKAKGIVLKPFFQTPPCFFDTDCCIFKTHYKERRLICLKDIEIRFLYILIITRCSSYNRISKSQKKPII
jgi:hypothetical protein